MLATGNTTTSMEEQQQRWLIDNLDSLEQYQDLLSINCRQLNNLQLPDLTPSADPVDDVLLERVEFDLKHSRVPQKHTVNIHCRNTCQS